jgi:putative transposase
VKFAFVKEHRKVWPVGVICRVLGVARSGFYAWLRRTPSARRRRRQELAVKIRAIHHDHRRVYGSPRVHKALTAGGEKVCRNTVASIMRGHGIRAKKKARFTPRTTESRHASPIAPNTLDRRFDAELPDRKWAADITYIPTDQGWLYLAAVIDLCTRRVVGWAMANHLKTDLVSDALTMALSRRRPSRGLLHHSDRGVQYASDDYQGLLAEHGLTCSMSGKGDCYDNSVIESFWSTLKTELVHHEHYATHEEARMSIFQYIEVFYNRKRLHSSLGYKSPEAFEASLN